MGKARAAPVASVMQRMRRYRTREAYQLGPCNAVNVGSQLFACSPVLNHRLRPAKQDANCRHASES